MEGLHSGVSVALHSFPVEPKLLPAEMRLVPDVDGSRDSMHDGTVSHSPARGCAKHLLVRTNVSESGGQRTQPQRPRKLCRANIYPVANIHYALQMLLQLILPSLPESDTGYV